MGLGECSGGGETQMAHAVSALLFTMHRAPKLSPVGRGYSWMGIEPPGYSPVLILA